VGLGGKVVYFRRLRFLDQADQVGGVRHVAVVQKDADVLVVWVFVEMIDALGV
jgi:hypothetical protein